MTGAPRAPDRSIYCIIYSAPRVQAEHINFTSRPSLLTRSCLLLKAPAPSRFLSLFFPPFVVFSSVHRGPGAPTPSAALIFIYSIFLSFFFFCSLSSVQSEWIGVGRVGGGGAGRKAAEEEEEVEVWLGQHQAGTLRRHKGPH